jgi:hypothetical protein
MNEDDVRRIYFFNIYRENINIKLDNIIYDRIKLLDNYVGKQCKSCGHIQGQSKLGYRYYFCIHTSNAVNKKLRKEKEKITKSILKFVTLSTFRSEVLT